MHTRQLEQGKRYRVRYRIPGLHRYDREAVMVYLGPGTGGMIDYLAWSARPVAGTQHLRASHIIDLELVDGAVGSYLNRRAP
jgi:hypothetical protein